MPIANALAPGALREMLTALSERLAALIILYGSSHLCFAFFLRNVDRAVREISLRYAATLRFNESQTMTHSVHPPSNERRVAL